MAEVPSSTSRNMPPESLSPQEANDLLPKNNLQEKTRGSEIVCSLTLMIDCQSIEHRGFAGLTCTWIYAGCVPDLEFTGSACVPVAEPSHTLPPSEMKSLYGSMTRRAVMSGQT